MGAPGARRVAAAGGAYALAYVVATGLLPAPSSAVLRSLLGDLLLAIPTAFALAATVRASRRALGRARAFWSVLAVACVAQVVNEAAYALHLTLLPTDGVEAVGHAGYYTYNVLLFVAMVVSPHRAVPRARAATLDCLMAAVAAYTLVFSFVAIPFGDEGAPWFWIFTGQQVLTAAGFAALAFSVREGPFAPVYRVLAAGYGLAALLGILPNWHYALGGYDLYSPANLDWVVALAGLTLAAAVPHGASWVQPATGTESPRSRNWIAAVAVATPASVDLAMRLFGGAPHLAEQRSELTLAATAVLALLAALRLRRNVRSLGAESGSEDGEAPAYVHFATGVAHELNNPLMVVAGWAELAVGRGEPRAQLEGLLAATRRAATIVWRLQQLGQAAGAPAEPRDAVDSGSMPAAAIAAGRWRWVAGGLLALAALSWVVRGLEPGPWVGDLLLAVPPAVAAALLARRGRATRSPRRRAFWLVLAAGPALWAAGELTWAALEAAGAVPAGPVLDILFLGFLVPMLVALALRPHSRERPFDAVMAADLAMVGAALLVVFARAVLLPVAAFPAAMAGKRFLLGALALVVAGWGAVSWRRAESAGWRRAYALVTGFAAAYGVLSSLANGITGQMPAPGPWTDVAWAAPFALLAAASLPGGVPAAETPVAMLFAPAAALGADLILSRVVPGFPPPHPMAAAVLAALAVLATALRLRLAANAERRTAREARLKALEMQRAGRLRALASATTASLNELQDVLEEVCQRARAAAVILPEKGDQMLRQARRAREIVRELAASLRLSAPAAGRGDLDLGALVEEVVQSALDEGLPLQVSLEGVAGLPRVGGDSRDLAAAIGHLLKNAGQASPGGVMRIRGTVEERHAVLRFADDGPGVPSAIREQVFNPFFTTRTVGEGVGLGLTLVHFAARAHGGSVVLEETPRGACFALRLPVRERPAGAVHEVSPFAAAALVAGAAAVLLAVLPAGAGRGTASAVLQVGCAMTAVGALVWAGWRQRGVTRAFWMLLAAGPALWSLTRILGVSEVGFAADPGGGVLYLALFAAADLSWAGALLIRPDRVGDVRQRQLRLGLGAALVLFWYAHAHLIVLPDPFALSEPALRDRLVLVRAAHHALLAAWAGVLVFTAASAAWRARYGRLALALALWAVGHSVAFRFRTHPDYQAGALSDLGWAVPFLWLAAVAVHEALRPEPAEPAMPLSAPPAPGRTAGWLVAMAAVVAFDSLFGTPEPVLGAAREAVLHVMVVVMALLLAVHDVLVRRAPRDPWRAAPSRHAPPSRWVKLVASAVHELGGQLSGVAAVSRVMLAQSDSSPRLHADAQRIYERAETATRVVRNLLNALPASMAGPERVSLNHVVEEAVGARQAAFAQDGVVVSWTPGRGMPELPLDVPALRHVIAWLLDRAAVSIRTHGPSGRIEVSTAVREGTVVVTVADSGATPAAGVLERLVGALLDHPASGMESELAHSLVRESVDRQGGTIGVAPRAGGGAVVTIHLPVSPAGLSAVPPADERGSAVG